MTLAVMGCVVNGPGESKAASIGISLPGTGEAPNCPVYIDGQHHTTLRGTYEELGGRVSRAGRRLRRRRGIRGKSEVYVGSLKWEAEVGSGSRSEVGREERLFSFTVDFTASNFLLRTSNFPTSDFPRQTSNFHERPRSARILRAHTTSSATPQMMRPIDSPHQSPMTPRPSTKQST